MNLTPALADEVRTLPSLIESRLRPETVYLRAVDARGVDQSAGELWQEAGRIANLLEDRGLRAGDRVAVQVRKSPEVLALFLGCARAGAVFVPISHDQQPPETDYVLGDARPALIVVDPEIRHVRQAFPAYPELREVLTLDDRRGGSLMALADRQAAHFRTPELQAASPVAILYTSGTTGRPKGAVLSHGNLASNAAALVDIWRFTADDVLIHPLPLHHTHGLFTASLTVMLASGSMLMMPKFDPDVIRSVMPRATSMMGVPTFYTRLLEQPWLHRDASSHMRVFISGSAPLLPATHRQFKERTGHAILERYGMTEASMIASNPYDGERRAGTVGFALPAVEIRVTDAVTGSSLPVGSVGMIEIRGPNVFQGYWDDPVRTAEAVRPDGWLISGDLGVIDDRGYLAIVGRDKDLIITGGLNVYPKEIEIEIDSLHGVAESAVIGLPHPDFGEAVTAVVVPRPGAELDEGTIIGALSTRLSRFKLPKRVAFVDELPRNVMGKVMKADLRKRFADLSER